MRIWGKCTDDAINIKLDILSIIVRLFWHFCFNQFAFEMEVQHLDISHGNIHTAKCTQKPYARISCDSSQQNKSYHIKWSVKHLTLNHTSYKNKPTCGPQAQTVCKELIVNIKKLYIKIFTFRGLKFLNSSSI